MRRDQFDRQSKFTRTYLDSLDPEERGLTELTKEYALSLHREVDEVLDEVPWKSHRRYDSEDVVRSNVAEELVDIIKFVYGLAHIWGIDYDELIREFDVKSDVVEDRWKHEHEASAFHQSTTPIVLLDLDGVLNDYPQPFLDFVHDQTGQRWDTIEQLDNHAPLTKQKLKHLWRQSGIKRTLPPNNGSVLSAQILAAAGYSIVIMSQRPADQYHRIYGDTLYWLRANRVPYDRLLFVPSKQHELIITPYLPRIAFAVDDDPAVVVRLCSLGIRTYWITDTEIEERPADLAHTVKSMLDIPEVRSATPAFREQVRGAR